jgi:hypothetical protein
MQMCPPDATRLCSRHQHIKRDQGFVLTGQQVLDARRQQQEQQVQVVAVEA